MNGFIQTIDAKSQKIGKHEIPECWWSRIYEYEFAKNFVNENEIVLDAGCGIEHPFKYFLADNKNKVTAVDIDENVLNLKYKNIEFKNIDLKNLSNEIPKKTFDKIFCISVIEHIPYSTEQILKQFYNVLKDEGRIIITFDYPLLLVKDFIVSVEKAGLQMVGYKNFETSENDLTGTIQEFRVFISILEKKKELNQPTETKPLQIESNK